MKKYTLKTLAIACVAALSSVAVHAVPAYNKPVRVTQPDGTVVTITLHGDERLHWGETSDGFTLLQDADGYWNFAKTDKRGNLVVSDLRYDGTSTKASAAGIRSGLRYSKPQVSRAMQAASTDDLTLDGTFPTTGKRKMLLLLVNYSNTRTTYSREAFNQMMNRQGYGGIGSFRDYYLEQSYGKLDIDVTVTDWIKLPKSKTAYGPDGAAEMISDALSLVSDTLDLQQFDNDGDGIIDGIAVIHQGTGQEASGNKADIWSHSSIIYGQKFGGVDVRRYTIEPELLSGGRMATIGVICHEFGHNLGAPDCYDTDYSESGGEYSGTGLWDLMGSGAWGGNYGTRPTGINGWQKSVWGWANPVTLDNDTVVAEMPAADSQPVIYRMETGTPGEYFIMENRQNSGTFDASLPGHGLVVYRVDENIIRKKIRTNEINVTHPQGIYTVCSAAGTDPDSNVSSYGSVNSDATPFPGTGGHTAFSDVTLPSAKSSDGHLSYRALANIAENGGKISFTFTHSQAPVAPAGLVATTSDGQVKLKWNMGDGTAAACDHFNVYRDGEKIGTATDMEYADTPLMNGKMFTYKVDAEYGDGSVSHPATVETMLPADRITWLGATTEDGETTLSWLVNEELTRADIYEGSMAAMDIARGEVEYGNKYTPDELRPYVGGQITKMAFLPVQDSSDLTVKFHVWEGNADGSDMTLVSERSVTSFTNEQRRQIKLTQPVTISEGKSYWVSVACVGNSGMVAVPFDESIITPGRGNLILDNGKFVETSELAGNAYVSATVTMPDQFSNLIDTPAYDSYDPAYDLLFPFAFNVYLDGQFVGSTTACEYSFGNVPDGTHTLKVACAYKGGNESAGQKTMVTVDGLETVLDNGQGTVKVVGSKGCISVSGGKGRINVFDVAGRHVASITGNGSVSLPQGVYVVAAGHGNTSANVKVVVE